PATPASAGVPRWHLARACPSAGGAGPGGRGRIRPGDASQHLVGAEPAFGQAGAEGADGEHVAPGHFDTALRLAGAGVEDLHFHRRPPVEAVDLPADLLTLGDAADGQAGMGIAADAELVEPA